MLYTSHPCKLSEKIGKKVFFFFFSFRRCQGKRRWRPLKIRFGVPFLLELFSNNFEKRKTFFGSLSGYQFSCCSLPTPWQLLLLLLLLEDQMMKAPRPRRKKKGKSHLFSSSFLIFIFFLLLQKRSCVLCLWRNTCCLLP